MHCVAIRYFINLTKSLIPFCDLINITLQKCDSFSSNALFGTVSVRAINFKSTINKCSYNETAYK